MSANETPRPLAAIVLAALTLAAGPIAALAPGAAAQTGITDVAIVLDRDPAHYMEGERVEIEIRGSWTVRLKVRVYCVDCPDAQERYETDARARLVFPDDFGVHARNDRQPKWNGTWRVDVLRDESLVQRKTFDVWLANLHTFEDLRPQASETVRFQSAGLVPRESYSFVVTQRRVDGSFETRDRFTARANDEGIARAAWKIPKSEPERFNCPGRERVYCQLYVVTVEGPGKTEESVRFTVVPAIIDILVLEGLSGDVPVALERTMNASTLLNLRYPGGDRVVWEDIRTSWNPEGILEMRVERTRHESREPPVLRAVVNATFNESRAWDGTWTIPRDEPLTEERYHLLVHAQEDAYGNRIRRTFIGNFTVTAATLTPVIVDAPERVERLALARATVAFRYHDGSPLKEGDEAQALRGYFVRDGSSAATCGDRCRADVAYWQDGLWNFTYRFPRDYPALADHRFVFDGGNAGAPVSQNGQDAWGNAFADAESPRAFPVVPASLRIDLTTVVDGEARSRERGLDRGDEVQVTARITYPDGSPFNRSVNEGERRTIDVKLVKRGADGSLAGEETLVLRGVRESGPDWTGRFTVALNATHAPLGEWILGFDVRDNLTRPNRNATIFQRVVNPAEISMVPTRQPPATTSTGSTVEYRFRLAYPDGTRVTPEDVGSRLHVNAFLASAVRNPGLVVSGNILPEYDPARDEWRIEWEVPRQLFQGQYAFRLGGGDRHGNGVDETATSRVFTTFTGHSRRVAIVEPPESVARGDTVTAIFDGRSGDIHHEPRNLSHAPVITLERWNPDARAWETVLADVRVPDDTTVDHVGRVETTQATQRGVYRFHFMGRDADFNLVNGTSRPFSLMATSVDRALLSPPPERVAKGQPVTWDVERRSGDTIQEVIPYYNGVPVAAQENLVASGLLTARPIYTTGEDRFTFTWRVPFTAESGDYSFRVRGHDRHGNRVDVLVPPVRAEPNVLTGTVIGHPDRTVARGDDASFLFAITYPGGGSVVGDGLPRVLVMNEAGFVDEADVTLEGRSFEGRWTPDAGTALGAHWFEISGVDASGNVFPALQSDPFTVEAGTVERAFHTEPAPNYVRLGTVRAELGSADGDAFVAFTLAYVGPASRYTEALLEDVDATTVENLEHTRDPSTGRYEIEWATERDTRPGVYRFEFTGQDANGNTFHGESDPFVINPLQYFVTLTPVQSDAFAPGNVMEFPFDVTFSATSQRRPDASTLVPDARVLWDGQPLKDRPEIRYDATREQWVATWLVPEDLPPGRYVLEVGGQDDAGNPISPRRGQVMEQEVNTMGALMRNVPVAGVPFLLLALVGAALVARRRVA